jgi:chromosome condensin MukBEF MukE localization factor
MSAFLTGVLCVLVFLSVKRLANFEILTNENLEELLHDLIEQKSRIKKLEEKTADNTSLLQSYTWKK